MALQIDIPRSHYDCFVQHPGWWAVMEKPTLSTGDSVTFALDGAPAGVADSVRAVVDVVEPPKDRSGESEPLCTFSNWWIIRYTVLP